MKRKIRIDRVIVALVGLIILVTLIFIPIHLYNLPSNKLKRLKYSSLAVNAMKEEKLYTKVLEKKKYSSTLDIALKTNNYVSDNFELYYEIDCKEEEACVKQINDLSLVGYKEKDITEIFSYLTKDDIDSVTNIAYISDLTSYISVTKFKMPNLERYILYKEETLTYEQCVLRVNVGLDKPFYSEVVDISNESSHLVLVNKYRRLSADFVPEDLEKISTSCSNGEKFLSKVAKEAFEELCVDASSVNLSIKASSAYRSYSYQANLYNSYVSSKGQKEADRSSAKPGHSEHQTGLAIDVASGSNNYVKFGESDEYEWIKDNAHKYGFIIRYTKETEGITGYMDEPWHIRYIGKEIATYLYENNMTYDEYYMKFID